MLEKITHCSQIQSCSIRELKKLADDCRKRILEATSKSGGHLASSLGAVELTVALANVFDFERDKVIWDVGHQAYTYKLLTGRARLLEKLGQKGGISKFLSRSESKYDYFGAGHASTSISAALGLSKAAELNGEGYKTVAVIGDGAMTGGLAYEALNHAGHLKRDLLVILNDNEMSIDPNVGALSKTLLNISSSQSFNLFRAEMIKQVRENKLPFGLRKTLDRLNDSLMAFFTKGVWFEKFEFRYFGQIDGHNIKKMISILNLVKHLKGPILLHAVTQKGKGCSFAEKNPTKYHGVGPFDLKTGKLIKSPPKGKSYTAIWGKSFAQIMASDSKVVGVSAAMLANTGLLPLQKKYPDRIFDVGIAEGHAVTFAGGLAARGIKPFVTIYSTFLQRAFDHIVHDIARQQLAVRFILDRGGFVGADGSTHHGVLDLTYLRMIPNMVIMAPKDGAETQAMLNTAHNYQAGPIALRFPRHATYQYYERPQEEIEEIPVGKGESLRSGDDILLIAAGTMVAIAEKAAEKLEDEEGISVGVINARFVKPLDEELILEEMSKVKMAATLEENAKAGGFGCGVLELLAEKQILKPVIQFGVPDRFIKFASRAEQLKESGLDVDSVSDKLKDVWKNLRRQAPV